LRDAGIRRPRWAAATTKASSGPGSLTQAEHRVAMLIAAGHTNKAAAAELSVSINTIATHLRAVFTKLGVRSRVQLANALRGPE
jgi:DNA-binding CsgD family transcriptional regulator